jgi:hypothetical protein
VLKRLEPGAAAGSVGRATGPGRRRAIGLLLLGGALLSLAAPLRVEAGEAAQKIELGAGDGLGERLFPRRQRLRVLGLEQGRRALPALCEGTGRLACLRSLLLGERAGAHGREEDRGRDRGGADRGE